MTKYYPNKPIRSFQDLQVYQLTYNLMVKISKKIATDLARSSNQTKKSKFPVPAADILTKTISKVPKLITIAHSIRFADTAKAIDYLEKAMLNCNLSIHCLEKYRDLENQSIKSSYFDTQIKKYLQVRGKILRLQKSWQKFAKNYAK